MFVVEQEPKKHPNINFRVGNPYLIVLIKEGILGYPNLINCLGPFLGPHLSRVYWAFYMPKLVKVLELTAK